MAYRLGPNEDCVFEPGIISRALGFCQGATPLLAITRINRDSLKPTRHVEDIPYILSFPVGLLYNSHL